jgi:hypothetical protein
LGLEKFRLSLDHPLVVELVEAGAGFFNHPPGGCVIGRPCFDFALKKQLFCAYKIKCLQADKKIKNRLKQRLFLVNAMRPKGAYFAQHERPITHANCIF